MITKLPNIARSKYAGANGTSKVPRMADGTAIFKYCPAMHQLIILCGTFLTTAESNPKSVVRRASQKEVFGSMPSRRK
jgi:hypothetical protein